MSCSTNRKVLVFILFTFSHSLVWGDEPMTPFREIKHNLVPLNNFYLDQTIISASYEEYGVSIIEADFTWQSTAAECSDDPAQLLLHYAWKQCPNPDQLPSAHLGHDLPDEFQGMMCSEKTPNGIDLCVYVYDDHNDDRMRRDMELLYKIRKLGIYVLPLTTGRSEQVKSYFAKVLTQYQVPCLDLSNIQVGKPPSFQYKDDRLSRIQGMECRQSNRPAVASYQILAVDQFCAIQSANILELLKRTRDREVERDENKRQDYNALLSLAHPAESPSAPAEPPRVRSSEDKREGVKIRRRLMLIFAFLSLCCALYIARTPTVIWTASFEIDQETGAISLFTKNPQGKLAWATTDPMIWLNDQTGIPLQKIPQSTGYYRLFLTMQPQVQQFTLHVNTTDTHIVYFDSRTTIYIHLASLEDNNNDSFVNNPTVEQEQEQPPNEEQEKLDVYESTLQYLVFYMENIKYFKEKVFTG